MTSLNRRGVLGLFDPTWPRTGLLEGKRLLDLVRPHIGDTFETLPRKFAAVAADLKTGREVVLRKGSVPDAVRASAAVPGLLMPHEIDGRMLVDGGIVNPIPVDVARALGGEFVIAVSVLGLVDDVAPEPEPQGLAAQWLARLFPPDKTANGKPVTAPAELPPEIDELGVIEIMGRASRIVQTRLAEERLRSHPPDAFIRISLPDISLFEFDRSSRAIEAGREAAKAALPEIARALEEAGSIPGRLSRWLRGTD